MNTLDKILIGCAAAVLIFTVTMIVLFCAYQSIPDTLVECFFALFTSEAFISFLIYRLKKKAAEKNGKS